MKKEEENAMKNIYYNNIWRAGTVQIYVDPPTIALFKIKLDLKT